MGDYFTDEPFVDKMIGKTQREFMEEAIKEIFLNALKYVTGAAGPEAIGGSSIRSDLKTKTGKKIASFFEEILSSNTSGSTLFLNEFNRAFDSFVEYYSGEEQFEKLNSLWNNFAATEGYEEKARIIAQIFVPELSMQESEILSLWKLKEVNPNPEPYTPVQVTIQLNALYSAPENSDPAPDIPQEIVSLWKNLDRSQMNHIADYDHPVPLFTTKSNHELEKCLFELENDLDFEKEKGVIPFDYKVPVTISVSVTHDMLDPIAGKWIEWLLRKSAFKNMRFVVLSEFNVNKIKQDLLSGWGNLFSVFGKYAVHFNALKYCQLFLEKSHGIKAGFKLDTDEGIRSRDLFKATGKTWFQTLCHRLWGGNARDYAGRQVYLGINEGEYINSTDIDNIGYEKAYKLPEVKFPRSFSNQQILFFKDQGQALVTELYNRFDKLEDNISHPVVKGGGYGIDNTALCRYTPFALSIVGRAEDQQYYFNGLAKGLRGIFHPNLRIAHYKQSVQASEKKQKGTKILGDMFRILIFSFLVEQFGVKKDIDPFPGLFAGKMARCQYFLNLVYQAFHFAENGSEEIAKYLLEEGLPQLESLLKQIDDGTIQTLLDEEEKEWREFVQKVSSLESKKVKSVMENIMIS